MLSKTGTLKNFPQTGSIKGYDLFLKYLGENYLKYSNSKFQFSGFKLFYKFFYPLDTVWHGDSVGSGLNMFIEGISLFC